jgi:prolyl oligopeptidase
MVAMYPELFGAVVCQVPLLDMKRYSHLLAGASWMEEYGDPDKPEEWAFLKAYSPYQNVQADKKYPPILFIDLDARRPRAPGPRAQDDGAHEGAGARRALLREHRGRARRRGQQRAAGAHVGAGLHVPLEAVEV